MMLSDPRGVGNTTLLNSLAEYAERQEWLTIGIEARPNDPGVAAVRARLGIELAVGLRRFSRKRQLQKAFDRLIGLARGFSVGIGVGPATVKVSYDSPAASSDDLDLDLEELVEAISTEIPVTRSGGTFTPDALSIVVDASGGYPYFLQEFGKEIWNVAATSTFDTDDAYLAVEEGWRGPDSGFYPSRWTRATDRERGYLRAMARTGDLAPRSGRIAAETGATTNAVSDIRDSAIKKGLIWSPEHGRVAFTVPHMADFILRQPAE
ncbi:hypothetical protein LH935_28055 (plasmid) [Gordonia polyisoprenivorans]|uniref:hypothetical protein n=1 Tax=Gordonia polyisoprenivorans TaxID=84595 RepID=UPI0022342B00|nr:hypothetical protein [uncultured Gordonia sp.]UZF59342.1 hypothetical protein LH935_28055 [Gordonia polyisoprenivorans]